jgi:RimJ/RimL family protein N-acetyltransferase
VTTTVEGEVARGARIVLREKRLSDAPDDFRWRTDVELARYDAARPFAASYEDYVALYRDELTYPSPYRRTLAIEDEGGQHIGNVMYYNIDAIRREAEIGITIGERDFWSHGYGSDVVRTLVRHIIETTGFRRVYLKTLDWNARARRAFEKAGFRQCGRSRRAGNVFIVMESMAPWLELDAGP